MRWAVPEELNTETLAALAEPDPAKRNEMYIDLQKKVQAKSPIVIMFQAATQVAMAKKCRRLRQWRDLRLRLLPSREEELRRDRHQPACLLPLWEEAEPLRIPP